MLTIEDGIATLLISRAQQKNALSLSMWGKLVDHIEEIKRAGAIVTVVRGAGHSFSAGGDLFEIAALETLDQAMTYWLAIKTAVEAVASLETPSIALIEGFCIGGGCRLALACDLRFATKAARFGLPEAKLGLICDRASVARLVHLIGPTGASEMLLSGELKTAEQALRLGLINEIVTEDRLADHVNQVARTLVRNDGAAVQRIKQIMFALYQEMTLGRHPRAVLSASTDDEDRYIAESFLAPTVKTRIKRLIGSSQLL